MVGPVVVFDHRHTAMACMPWMTQSWMTASGLLKHDPFITTPNAPGVFLAVFCTMTTYGLADERVRRTHLTCMSRKVVGTQHPFPVHDTPSLMSPTTSFLAVNTSSVSRTRTRRRPLPPLSPPRLLTAWESPSSFSHILPPRPSVRPSATDSVPSSRSAQKSA